MRLSLHNILSVGVMVVGMMHLGAERCRADGNIPPAAPMPHGAFLRRPAADTGRLSRQVGEDSLVASRYARLFHLSPPMVKQAFAGMHLMALPQDQVFEVHYVHAGEVIGYKLRRVRKGTRVYALPNGTPALMQVCGNPLRSALIVSYPETSGFSSDGAIPYFSPDEPLETQRTASSPARLALRLSEPSSLPGPLSNIGGANFVAAKTVAVTQPLPKFSGSHFPIVPFPGLADALPMAGVGGFMVSRDAAPKDHLPDGSVPDPEENISQWANNEGQNATSGPDALPAGDGGIAPDSVVQPADEQPTADTPGSSRITATDVPEPGGQAAAAVGVLSSGWLLGHILIRRRRQ